MISPTIALVGNPNCGKTTLFNILTGNREKTGNRAGVTFSVKTSRARKKTKISALIADLPGIYSLSPAGNDEKIADEYLRTSPPDVVINILDATNLSRGLFLTTELAQKHIPIVLALNMADEAKKEGLTIDAPALSSKIGAPVVLVSAAKNNGINELCAAISSLLRSPQYPRSFSFSNERKRAEFAENLAASVTRENGAKRDWEDKLDAFICKKSVGIPLFFLVMMCVFMLTFSSFGNASCALAEKGFSVLTKITKNALFAMNVNETVTDLVVRGIFGGLGAVVSFLPKIIILFSLLEMLEDSGYLSRAAFAMDAPMRTLGLSGKAFIPIATGFGCTVPAVLSTQILEKEERENVIFSLPFVPCGARLPVFSLIIGSFFAEYEALASFCIYALGVLATLFSLVLRSKGNSAPPLSVELPKYRLPKLSNVVRAVSEKLADFLSRAGSIIFLSSMAVYILSLLTPTFHVTSEPNESLLAYAAKFISPLMSPLGLGDFRVCAALFSGLFAKESIVSTLSVLGICDISSILTKAQAVSLAVFSLLYSPCLAAMSACKVRMGGKKALHLFFRTLTFAYIFAFVAYTSARLYSI